MEVRRVEVAFVDLGNGVQVALLEVDWETPIRSTVVLGRVPMGFWGGRDEAAAEQEEVDYSEHLDRYEGRVKYTEQEGMWKWRSRKDRRLV